MVEKKKTTATVELSHIEAKLSVLFESRPSQVFKQEELNHYESPQD
jgi:hypothetical protein